MTKTYNLEFITPAFLTGANQSCAELRAPSVRGALRWWFRALGGTREEEAEVFGGVHGGARKSKVVVRTEVVKPVHKQFDAPRPLSDLGYLYYFATVSGERKGIRVESSAYYAEETQFTIQVSESGLDVELSAKFWHAVECFIRLGALGLRATRGCGAFVETVSNGTQSEFVDWANAFPQKVGKVVLVSDDVFTSARKAQEALGGYLRQFRSENHLSGKRETAIGYSLGNKRMASALKLRPVKVKEGYLAVVFYSDAACTCASVEHLLP